MHVGIGFYISRPLTQFLSPFEAAVLKTFIAKLLRIQKGESKSIEHRTKDHKPRKQDHLSTGRIKADDTT